MRRRLNWKLLLVVLVVGAGLGAGAYLLHQHQRERLAAELRAKATHHLNAGEYEWAERALMRYLTLVPDDENALAEYGVVNQLRGRNDLALRAYKEVLRRDPTRRDVRRSAIDLTVQFGQWTTAASLARGLLEQGAESEAEAGDMERILGLCHEAKRRFPEAAEAYARAIGRAPHLIEAYLRRASLLRDRLKEPHKADLVMTHLVNYNPESFRAFFERGRYRQKWQQSGGAEDLQQARTLARAAEMSSLDDFLAAAELARAEGDLAEARTYLARAAEQFTSERRLYQQLARLELLAQQPEQAVAVLQSGLAILPGDRDLRVRLVEALLAAGQAGEAQKELEILRKSRQMSTVLLHYLDAHVLVQGKQWAAASHLLEGIRDQLAAAPDLRAEADHLLSLCYESLGDRNQYLASLQRSIGEAAKGGFRTGMSRYRLGAALLAAGRLEEALRELNLALKSTDVPPAVWLRLAEGTLALALRAGEDQRPQHWAAIDQYLAQAEQALPQAVEVPLLRAEVLVAQGMTAEAEAALQQARDQQPNKIEFWAALVALQVRRNAEPAAIRALLDQVQRKLGDTADVRLLRGRWASMQPREEARKALTTLARNLDKFAPEDQPRMLAGFAEAFTRIGDSKEAEQLWLRYLEQQPQDLRARQLLFELVLQAGKDEAAERTVADLRQAEGEDGIYWRACAAAHYLIRAKRDGAAEAAGEARRLLGELRQLRPKWARLLVLEGEMAELEGNQEEAVAKYQQALDQGERSPRLIQRTVQLLTETRQYRAADALIGKIGGGAAVEEVLRLLNIEASLRGNNLGRAESLARAAVAANPNDYRHHLWLGQILAAAGKLDEAEKVFHRTTDKAGHLPEPWIVLVQLQARRDLQKAEATLEQARASVPPENVPLMLGPCYEFIGQMDKAAEQYAAALAAKPGDPGVMRVAALAFARAGDAARSEALLRKIFEPATRAPEALAAWARRTLAVNLAGRNYQRFKEGIALLEQNARRVGISHEDQRVRAHLHEQLGQRHEAIRILEELSKQTPLTPADQFALAQLYETTGNWAGADQFLTGLTSAGGEPAVLVYHARGLIRNGEAARARPLVEKLEKAAPKALTTLELQARLLHAEGQAEQAVQIFQGLLQEAKEPEIIGLVAVLLDELGLADAAERTYRSFRERSQKPESGLSLARFLARKGRTAEALDLCEQAAEQLPAEAVAGVMAGAVRAGTAGKELTSRAERWVRKALDVRGAANDAGTATLLLALADVYDYQGRSADAIQTYRRVLAINPNSVEAANNLAWLIAMNERKNSAEALKHITHVIDNLAGPNPALLDTRGTVLLALGRSEEAILDLQTAVAEAQSPVRYFHLAQAYRQAKRRPEAKEALEVARALGLDAGRLHPLERSAYKTLCVELGIKQ